MPSGNRIACASRSFHCHEVGRPRRSRRATRVAVMALKASFWLALECANFLAARRVAAA